MGQISLVVTSKVLKRDAAERINERQIAFRTGSTELARVLETADGANRVTVRIGGFASLVVGDRGSYLAVA